MKNFISGEKTYELVYINSEGDVLHRTLLKAFSTTQVRTEGKLLAPLGAVSFDIYERSLRKAS